MNEDLQREISIKVQTVRMDDFKLEGGELFKTRMNLSQETIDKKFILPKTANKISTTRKAIGCFT